MSNDTKPLVMLDDLELTQEYNIDYGTLQAAKVTCSIPRIISNYTPSQYKLLISYLDKSKDTPQTGNSNLIWKSVKNMAEEFKLAESTIRQYIANDKIKSEFYTKVLEKDYLDFKERFNYSKQKVPCVRCGKIGVGAHMHFRTKMCMKCVAIVYPSGYDIAPDITCRNKKSKPKLVVNKVNEEDRSSANNTAEKRLVYLQLDNGDIEVAVYLGGSSDEEVILQMKVYDDAEVIKVDLIPDFATNDDIEELAKRERSILLSCVIGDNIKNLSSLVTLEEKQELRDKINTYIEMLSTVLEIRVLKHEDMVNACDEVISEDKTQQTTPFFYYVSNARQKLRKRGQCQSWIAMDELGYNAVAEPEAETSFLVCYIVDGIPSSSVYIVKGVTSEIHAVDFVKEYLDKHNLLPGHHDVVCGANVYYSTQEIAPTATNMLTYCLREIVSLTNKRIVESKSKEIQSVSVFQKLAALEAISKMDTFSISALTTLYNLEIKTNESEAVKCDGECIRELIPEKCNTKWVTDLYLKCIELENSIIGSIDAPQTWNYLLNGLTRIKLELDQIRTTAHNIITPYEHTVLNSIENFIVKNKTHYNSLLKGE